MTYFWLAFLVMCKSGMLSADENSQTPIRAIITLDEPALNESSGLSISRRTPERIWSHNDSGDGPTLFAFDTKSGKKTGKCTLKGADAVDWEDMAGYTVKATSTPGEPTSARFVSRLLVADCGDNQEERDEFNLYFLDEPDPNSVTKLRRDQYSTLTVRYPDGPHNCEAIAVDTTRQLIVLVTKRTLPIANVYTIPLPTRVRLEESEAVVTAKKHGTLPIPMVTSIDVDVTTGDFWITNYWDAFTFKRQHSRQSLIDQLKKVPTSISLPNWKQIEAVAVDSHGRPWISTEGLPTTITTIHHKGQPQ